VGDESAGRFATVSAALLLGGEGASAIDPAGLATQLARLFEDVMLVGGDPAPELPGRRVADVDGPDCVLRGVVSALAAARGERVLVVAGDLPDLTPELLLAIVAWPEADLVCPRTRGGLQPVCGLYRRDAALEVARRQLAEGRLSLNELASALDTAELGAEELARLDLDTRPLEPTRDARENGLSDRG
jgi:molybdopterin-guanine dinucleotide biosynthesis protein A